MVECECACAPVLLGLTVGCETCAAHSLQVITLPLPVAPVRKVFVFHFVSVHFPSVVLLFPLTLSRTLPLVFVVVVLPSLCTSDFNDESWLILSCRIHEWRRSLIFQCHRSQEQIVDHERLRLNVGQPFCDLSMRIPCTCVDTYCFLFFGECCFLSFFAPFHSYKTLSAWNTLARHPHLSI